MSFIFMTNVDTDKEVAHEVPDMDALLTFVQAAFDHRDLIPDGGMVCIRRADYLDKPKPSEVGSKPRLTLIKGGKKLWDQPKRL